MLHFRPSSVLFPLLVLAALATQPAWTRQDHPPEPPQDKLGPKVEPAAMGSDYQPLLWQGADAAFARNSFDASTCQLQTSNEAASKSSNVDLQQLAATSISLQQRKIKKLKSMAKVIDFKLSSSKKHPQSCAEVGELAQLSGANFDGAYLAYLAKDNAAELMRFQSEADAQSDSANFELRKFADATLPTLVDQQSSIRTLQQSLTPAKK